MDYLTAGVSFSGKLNKYVGVMQGNKHDNIRKDLALVIASRRNLTNHSIIRTIQDS